MIVAEMSANHNGKKETAIETVRAAKRAGADAVKLQTYRLIPLRFAVTSLIL